LLGLPLIARVLYLQGLRRHMDFATGIVGVERKISWQMLREVLYVEPHQGVSDAGTPSMGKVRRALDWLIRAGLVEDRGEKLRGSSIVFFLPLAFSDDSAQKKPGKNPARTRQGKHGIVETTEKTTQTTAYSATDQQTRQEPGKLENQKAGNPPLSVIRIGDSSYEESVDSAFAETDETPSAPVRAVFDYWRERSGHNGAKLDDKRRSAIAARLKNGYSVRDLKRAVDGCIASPWHQGQNGNRRKYDDIELICRNASKVDQFVALAGSARTEDARLDDWINADRVFDGECKHV